MSITPAFEVGKTYRTANGQQMKIERKLDNNELLGRTEDGLNSWSMIYFSGGQPRGGFDQDWQLLPGAIEDEKEGAEIDRLRSDMVKNFQSTDERLDAMQHRIDVLRCDVDRIYQGPWPPTPEKARNHPDLPACGNQECGQCYDQRKPTFEVGATYERIAHGWKRSGIASTEYIFDLEEKRA